MSEDIAKLEELFKNGFILEDEFNSRKASIVSSEVAPSTDVAPMAVDDKPAGTAITFEPVRVLPEIVDKIKAPANVSELEASLTQLRKALSIEKNPPIEEVLGYNILPTLQKILEDATLPPVVVFETLWILTNIVSGNTEQANQVVQAGLLPSIIKYLSYSDSSVCEQAIWALGNVAGDSIKSRDIVLGFNVIPPLTAISNNNSYATSIFRNLTWTLSNLCRGKPSPPFYLVEPLIDIFARMLKKADTEVQTDALWGLSYLSDGANHQIQKVIEAGVLPDILDMLGATSPQLVTPALRIVGNIVTGDDLQTQLLLNFGVLTRLQKLLSSVKKGIVKEACWTVSNITAGNKIQIQAVLDCGILKQLSEILKNRTRDHDIGKEALWAIANATSGASNEQMHKMVNEIGIIPGIVSMMSASDERVLSVALEGLENIMRVAASERGDSEAKHVFEEVFSETEGEEILENLLDHPSHSVSNKAATITGFFSQVDV